MGFNKIQFSIKANTYIYLAILLLAIPLRWVVSWITAIAFHEFCHWLGVKLCKGSVFSLEIGLGGADMQCSNMTDRCRLLAILCGPVGGLFLCCAVRYLPRVAICSFFLSAYNLLPILPLDGGRALHIFFCEQKWLDTFEKIFLTVLISTGLFCAFCLRVGLLPLTIAIVLCLKNRKIPCK